MHAEIVPAETPANSFVAQVSCAVVDDENPYVMSNNMLKSLAGFRTVNCHIIQHNKGVHCCWLVNGIRGLHLIGLVPLKQVAGVHLSGNAGELF